QPAVLARKVEPLWAPRCGRGDRSIRLGLLRQCRRNEPERHARGKYDGPADGSAHGGETGTTEKAAPAYVGPAAEQQGIGALGIVGIELTDRPFFTTHSALSAGERNRDGLPST